MKKMAFALAAAAAACTCFAATPVAVWDGDFTATQTGFTLNRSGNAISQDNSTITIDQSVGVKIDFDSAMTSGMTVMFRYADLNLANATNVLAASFVSGGDENRTGVCLVSGTVDNAIVGSPYGIWNTGFWPGTGSTKTTANVTSAMTSGVMVFTYYKVTDGTSLYRIADGTRTTIYRCAGLGTGNDTAINGCTIGGERAKSGATLLSAATDMKITGIAIFDGILTEAEMTGYVWPSEIQTIDVSANTSVSAINALYDSTTYKVAKVMVADGVTIDVDAAFSANIRSVSSEGTITLSADSQPDASCFANVDFSGVQGGLLRSWYASSVVGFNFRSSNGTDVSGALASTENWVHDNNSANGTSTAMFADGLSTLTWASATTWSCSGSTIISGYLDDGSKNGHGAEVHLTNVPYKYYDVIVYCSSDSNPGTFLAKTVNGTSYTWDSAAGAVVEGSSVWGKAALTTPVYGVNALRIKNLSGPLTIYGGVRDGSNRGGIAAFQIMPPDTPDNITYYTLALDGTTTAWSAGSWKIGSSDTSAPLTGFAKITLTASTTLIVDTEVSLTQLVVEGKEDAVLTMSLAGGGTFIADTSVVVKGCVLQQGSEAVLGATPSVVVEDGATFDMNGFGVNSATSFTIAGAGAGSWPWALTSSSGAGGAILGGLYLSANATIGGANELKIGQSDTGYYCYLRGYTLTKTGAGALTCTNMNTPGTGTIDLQGGAMTVNQWNNLNSGSGNTTLTLREGASFTQNSSSHQIAVDTLNFVGGTLNTPNPFYVKSLLTGAGETARLVFRDGATIEPTGELKVTGELSLDGSLTVSTARINPAEIAVGQTIDLFTAPVGTTLSSDAITVKSSSRFETAISDNKVTATAVALKNFLHYDFNGGASIAADSTYSLNSDPDPECVGGWNGDAGVFDSTCMPWYDSNSSGKSPFHAGEMTVMTLLKIREANNTILWNLGSGFTDGIALIAKDSSTLAIVSWAGQVYPTGGNGSDVVSVTDIAKLMNKWHLVTIVANEDGTTLYVDDQYATVSTILPSDIGGQGQFGNIHGTSKNYTAVSGDGYLLDDWRVYDAALTHAEVKALKSELLPKPFNFILR